MRLINENHFIRPIEKECIECGRIIFVQNKISTKKFCMLCRNVRTSKGAKTNWKHRVWHIHWCTKELAKKLPDIEAGT